MPEHKEELNKPWSIWAWEKCRECNHAKLMHLLENPDNSMPSYKGLKEFYVVGACNDLTKGMGFCNCQEFIPSDNLDYIEFLAKRKGLIEDNEDKE